MNSEIKIKLSVVPNPFKVERIDLNVEPTSFQTLFDTHVNTHLPIKHAVIFDGDTKIFPEDYDSIPTSEHVIIKMLPAGGTATPGSVGSKIGGGLLAILGAILMATGVGGFLGSFLLGTGVSLFAGGWVLYWSGIPDLASRDTPEQLPSLRGGKNQTRIDGMVPILLGKHLMIPDNAALSYTVNSGSDQYLHQLFCAGYEDIVIDENTMKIGNTELSAYSDVLYEINKSDTIHTYYPERVVSTFIGVELLWEDNGVVEEVERTTSTDTKQITVSISFPSGLIRYNDDGDEKRKSVTVVVHYKSYDSGTWLQLGTQNFNGKQTTTLRWEFSKTLDNDLVSGADYNDLRKYDVRVRRGTPEVSSKKQSQTIEAVYWDTLKCHTGAFDDISAPNTRPIVEGIQTLLTTISMSIRATDQLNGVVDQLNFIAQLHTNTYSGTGTGASEWTTVQSTSNPASMFRYVLQDSKVNPHPVTDDQIDWESLETWYTFCETKNFECNAVLNGDIITGDVLNSIMLTGRASWLTIDGLYTVVIDDVKPNVIQMFTPRNSWGFMGRKAFAENPTVLKLQYIDAGVGYVSTERKVYYDDDTPDDSLPTSVTLFGVTDPDQAWKLGKYMLAVNRLRPESYQFSVDIENIVCTRGDRVTVTHDSALIGLYSGRSKAILVSGGDTDGFTSDELLNYESGKTYGVRIRLEDGSILEEEVINQVDYTDVVEFSTPLTGVGILQSSELFTFGELGEEVLDVLITSIEPGEELTAVLSCVEYAPDVFTADSGTIPDYNPLISIPAGGETGIVIGTLFDPEQNIIDVGNQAAIDAGYIARAGNSLIASRPDAFSMLDDAFEVCFSFSGEIVYVEKDTMFLYKTRKTDTFDGEAIGTVVAGNPASADVDGSGDSRILYVNKEDNDRIYIKTIVSTATGSPVTATGASQPRYIGDDEFLYVNFDGTLYRGLITDALDGTQITTFGIGNYDVTGLYDIVYANLADDSKLYVKTNSADDVGTKVGEVPSGRLSYSDTFVYYLNYDDEMNIYKKELVDTTDDGVPAYTSALDVAADANGDVAYISLYDDNFIYSGLEDLAITGGFLEASPNQFVIIGDLTTGSAKITNMTADAISQVVANDNVYHAYLPLDTKIIFRGNNYVTLDNLSTGTLVSQSIQVAGTRIILDANRVIIDGTVTANLLEASAINSKAKTVGGFFKTEFGLDDGTAIFRKDDDTAVLDFDPDRVSGAELQLNGDLEITSDDESRHIQVGSKGLLVEDSASTIIHDLPDIPIAVDQTYLGHLVYLNGDTAASPIFSTTGSLSDVWHTFTADDGGNGNVKGGLFVVYATDLSQEISSYYISCALRPFGTTWPTGLPTGAVTPYVANLIGGFGATKRFAGAGIGGMLVVPFGTSDQVQVASTATSFLVDNSITIYVSQLGVYI